MPSFTALLFGNQYNMPEQRPLFYDLTELYYLSGASKTKTYGIARVVEEGARAILKSNRSVRFVAYSQCHKSFFEVFPTLGENGTLDVNMPNQGKVPFVRRRYYGKKRLLAPLAQPIDAWHRRFWRKSGIAFTPVSLAGGAFISCARPKLLVDTVEILKNADCGMHILLHDLIPLFDHSFRSDGTAFQSSFFNDNKYLIGQVDQIIGNSRFTVDDITRYADKGVLPHPKSIAVAQLAHELIPEQDGGGETPQTPYFLMVGTLLGRKNLDVVLAAIALLVTQGKTPPTLVLAGQVRKRTVDLLDSDGMKAVKPYVTHISNPPQSQLERLYKKALGVILPSRIEGWGLPAAEALWCGTPAICSDIPVLHEVCGDLALYFGVDDAATLAGHMDRLAIDSTYQSALRSRIAERAGSLRTWQQFGDDLLQAVVTFYK